MKTNIIAPARFLLTILLFCALSLGAQTRQVASVSITVSRLEKSLNFYRDVLSFQPVDTFEWSGPSVGQLFGLKEPAVKVKGVRLRLGEEQIELLEFQNEARAKAIPADSHSNDRWFQHIAIVVSDMDAAYRQLKAHQITYVSSSPQTLPDYLPNAAGISAFYFRDPDGHNLELIHFPPGKGNPKWQTVDGGRQTVDGRRSTADGGQPTVDSKEYATSSQNPTSSEPSTVNRQPSTVNRLPSPVFLGIDHTAIGIDDTDAELKFYRDLLGLIVGGNSENYGPEQEHLNQVFGAHLWITGMKAPAGFGVEFLQYLAPPGGRPYPADSRPTDLWHWHTRLKVDNLPQVLEQVRKNGYQVVSAGLTNTAKLSGFSAQQAILVRDAEGHAVLLTN